MNKATKIIIEIMVGVIIIYILVCLYQNNSNRKIPNVSDYITGYEEKTSGEMLEEYLSSVKYSLESGENEITLISEGKGERSVTKYLFEEDKLSKIIVSEELFSEEAVEPIYERLMADESLSQTYSSIEIEGNTIVMTLKEEYVNSYGEKGIAEVYESLSKSVANY